MKQTESQLGPVDILVNAAGIMFYTLMKNVHEDEWERQVDVNCKVKSVWSSYCELGLYWTASCITGYYTFKVAWIVGYFKY